MDFRLVNRLAFNQIIHRAFQLAMVLLQIHSNSEAPQTNLHRFHLRDQRRMRILQPLQFNLEMHLQRQHLGSSRISKDFSLELDPLMYVPSPATNSFQFGGSSSTGGSVPAFNAVSVQQILPGRTILQPKFKGRGGPKGRR
jgi:hypothetical protein